MTIVLFILKIIGMVILAVLGILLLVLAAVLFVPFRYRICVESDGDEKQDCSQSSRQLTDTAENEFVESAKKDLRVTALARVHWLLHFLGVEVSFLDGQLNAYLRIFFWKKKLLNNEEAKEEEDVKPSEGTVMLSQDTESDSQDDTPEARQQKAPGNTISEEKQKNSKGDGNKKNSSNNNEEKNKKENDRKEKDKEENNKENNNREEQSGSILARMKKLWNDFSNLRKKITRMVEDERNHRAVAHVKAELIRILKAIRPRKLSIDMEFSLGSPDLTGEALGVCAWFPIFYQKENRLIPDFEADEAYAKGHVDAKGRIYLFQILFAVLRILFDKDCKRMYRMFKKYFG